MSRRIAMITFAVRILSGFIAYVSQVLLARWMGDFQYGVFVVVWTGAVIVGGLACLGIQTALLRFVPEYAQRGDVRLQRGVVVGSRIQGFVASTFFAIVGGLGLYAFGQSPRELLPDPALSRRDHAADAGDLRNPGQPVASLQLGGPQPLADVRRPSAAHPAPHVGCRCTSARSPMPSPVWRR
ncbi:MAG: hypothetical protein WDM84_09335 [Bauldia sp.]